MRGNIIHAAAPVKRARRESSRCRGSMERPPRNGNVIPRKDMTRYKTVFRGGEVKKS